MGYIRPIFTERSALTAENIRRMKDTIGLTALVPDCNTTHNSGFSLPDELSRNGPFKGWEKREDRVRKHLESNKFSSGAWPVFQGVPGKDEDKVFLKIIEDAEKEGVEVYGHMGLWNYCGDIMDEYGFEDVDGDEVSDEYLYLGVPICPANEEAMKWTADCLRYIVKKYNLKGMDFDHAHMPSVANVDSLFGCACHSCRKTAYKLGYDFKEMVKAIKALKRNICNIDRDFFIRTAGESSNLLDLFSRVASSSEIMNWFKLRAHTNENSMRKYTEAIKEASNGKCLVETQLQTPTYAYICGQDIQRWSTFVDRLTPGWGPWVGWEHGFTVSVVNLTKYFMDRIKGLGEKETIEIFVRLLGYLPERFPHSITELNDRKGYSFVELLIHQLKYAKSLVKNNTPVLPPFRLEQREFDTLDYRKYEEYIKIADGNFMYGGSTDKAYLDKIALLIP